MYYVYILRCLDQSLYTGITTDVKRRFQEHKQQSQKGAKYTYVHIPVEIVAVWTCGNRSQASKLEYWIKKLSKSQKEKIIVSEKCFKEFLEDKIEVNDYQFITIDHLCRK